MNAVFSGIGAMPNVRVASCFVVLMSLLIFSGCPAKPVETPVAPSATKSTKKLGASSAICVDSFERAVGVVQPESLGLDTDPNTAIALLNEWVTYCAPDVHIEVGLKEVEEKYLTSPVWDIAKSRLGNQLYDNRDVQYMRDAYLFRRIGEKLAKQADNDLARVNGFFDYVCTNIALDPSLTGTTPHTAFESLLWGLGSPADRAWVFLGMLRQMKFPGVIFTFDMVPLQAYGQPYLLVGVPIGDQVYLYDPMLGMPLPTGVRAEDGLSWKQATWSEFNSGHFWDNYEKINLANALTATKPGDVKAWLFGTSSGWSVRMQEFESFLRGDQVVTLFDPLVDIQGKTSLIAQGLPQRVRVGLPEGTLPDFAGVWTYPEEMINSFTDPSEQQKQMIALRMRPFQTASTILTASTSQRTGSEDGQHQDIVYDYSKTEQLKYYQARLSQLLQKYEYTIPAFMKLSLNVPQAVATPEQVVQMIIAQDSSYWLGLSQFESEYYPVAADSLRRYLDQYGREGRWFQPALINYCKALAASGDKAKALEYINRVTLESPQVQEALYLLKCWQTESTPTESKPANADSGKPKQDTKPDTASPSTPAEESTETSSTPPGSASEPSVE